MPTQTWNWHYDDSQPTHELIMGMIGWPYKLMLCFPWACHSTLRLLLYLLMILLPMSSPAAEDAATIAADQRQLAERYQRLETLALRVAELNSEEQPERAAQLRRAVQQSRELALGERFTGLVDLLREEQLAAAIRDQQQLTAELSQVLRTLLEDPRLAAEEARREQLKALRQGIQQALRQQRALRASLAGPEVPPTAEPQQQELKAQTAKLEQDSKSLDAEPTPSLAQQPTPTKALKQAGRAMGKAQQNLSQGQSAKAQESQLAAEEQLEEAQRAVEERLRQQREEELLRLLATLAARLRQLEEQQQGVYDDTVKQAAEATSPRRLELAAQQLAEHEDELIRLAERTIVLLVEEGNSIAFLEALRQIRADMQAIAAELRRPELGETTQELEREVLAALAELVAAADQALQNQQAKQGQPNSPQNGQGQAGEQPLIDKLAELRMIRTLQARILRRTIYWRDHRTEANEPAARAELSRLAEQQRRLTAATLKLTTE